jgi:cytochrome c oxidase subunit 2
MAHAGPARPAVGPVDGTASGRNAKAWLGDLPMASHPRVRRRLRLLLVLMFVAVLAAGDAGSAPNSAQIRHDVVVNAKRFEFSPSRIEVSVGDIVKVTLVAEDIPHSFTIDDYRISKRAAPGKQVTFEFYAARAGTFDFYCDLTIDEGCRKMKGQLIVTGQAP